MKLNFDFKDVPVTEFGVGLDNAHEQPFRLLVVDPDVQAALRDMAFNTWDLMNGLEQDPATYEPSEKYSSKEYVYLPLNDDLAQSVRTLHEATNLPLDMDALSDPSNIFCYFAQMTDKQKRRLTAVRRATQFKGILKNRLIRLLTDALRIIEENVFKLDNDFDLLADNTNIHVLRPSGLEFVGKLQEAVLAAVPKNVKAIQNALSFVDFDGIQEYASTHARAARCLASIRTRKEMQNIDKTALRKLCKLNRVTIEQSNGKIVVPHDQILSFLEVLERRRYEVELVKGSPEYFRAGSRRKI